MQRDDKVREMTKENFIQVKDLMQVIYASEKQESSQTKIVSRSSQEYQLVITMVHLSPKLSQHMEQEYHEGHILNPLLQFPKVVATQGSFPKFVLSMENLVAILDSYTYVSLSKKVICRVVKKVKISKSMEEKIMEQQVLMGNYGDKSNTFGNN